ncbi:MAG: oxidoreductase family protein [Verrucomicrobiales bacterium]
MIHSLGNQFESAVLAATGAKRLEVVEVIQELWSGYGKIVRIQLEGDVSPSTVVAKHVRFPTAANHPRGWNSDASHQRKVRSYEVETHWYRYYAARCAEACRVPCLLAFERDGDEVLMVLDDLDAVGFPERMRSVEWPQVQACLRWLAGFHATFMGVAPDGLWEVGTYWHLETRSEEWQVLDDRELKASAAAIDQTLNTARYQTLVHGDAKLANFCFSKDGQQVAAVDFQYVGGGCGMKDVAYFVGSCLDEAAIERHETELLDHYFSELRMALDQSGKVLDFEALSAEWRGLYPLAWTDFHRFLKGWSPGHWKINSYSERLAREVVASLK